MDQDQVVTAKLVKTSSGFIPGPAAAMMAAAFAIAAIFVHRRKV
jgi:hypothetical protein